MISSLNPGLSQRVVRAVHNRLRQALNMSAVPETATAVPESGAAVPETGAAVPETEEANADAPGIAHLRLMVMGSVRDHDCPGQGFL